MRLSRFIAALLLLLTGVLPGRAVAGGPFPTPPIPSWVCLIIIVILVLIVIYLLRTRRRP